MKIVAHRGTWSSHARQNSLPSLIDALNCGLHIETDLRLHDGQVVLSHDPVKEGDRPALLTSLLNYVECDAVANSAATLFLNVKEDGLLPYLQSAKAWDNKPVVFFDMSVPELVRYSRVVPAAHLATRWSDVEREPVLYDRCDWLWVDCFEQELPLSRPEYRRYLQEKKVVFVSPELHGRNAETFLKEISNLEVELLREVHLCQDVNPNSLT